MRALEEAGIEAEDIAVRRPTLDEVFLHLTDRRRRPHEHARARREPPGTSTRTGAGCSCDSWTMTRRELAHWARQPVQMVVGLVFPVMLLLMFGYLVGGGRGSRRRRTSTSWCPACSR